MSDSTTTFAALGLGPRLVEATARLGFTTPTPIQARAIPALLAGRDIIGGARTGSGKTAAFGLPILERLEAQQGKKVRALVLTPTRELALQVTEALRSFYDKLPVVTLYGGAPFGPQLSALRSGVGVVVGTPGRILDHLDRGTLDLSELGILILDEADEMLRMGFIDDVERILGATPATRQVALFSATMPAPIRRIARKHLRDPLEVQVENEAITVEHIEQRWLCVPERFKADALARIIELEHAEATLVFSRTRIGCASVADVLSSRGPSVDAIHGDLPQAARERVLARLRAGKLDVLVATDVAARGIDVDHLELVINHDLPADLESYAHRIGRTGRAGRAGKAISLVTPDEVRRLRAFERRLGVSIEEMRPPSNADIARAGWRRLERELALEMKGEGNDAIAVDETVAAIGGASPQLTAALRLLAAHRGLPLDEKLDDKPPAWARRETPKADKASFERTSFERESELFLPIGKQRGVRPADLVGALAGDFGIAGSQIGRITVLQHKSFVALPHSLAARILRGRKRLQVRGNNVPVTEARGRPAGERPTAR